MCSVSGMIWQRPQKSLRPPPPNINKQLLANKGERGRRKLADHWDSHLHTVVEKHENTHTFWIKSCTTDREKVVHRNLIMPVNFLPIPPGSEDDGSSVSDLATGATDDSLPDGNVGSAVLPNCESEDRTVSWISRLPDSNEDPLDALSGD